MREEKRGGVTWRATTCLGQVFACPRLVERSMVVPCARAFGPGSTPSSGTTKSL